MKLKNVSLMKSSRQEKKLFCPKAPASTNAQGEIFFLRLHASQITKEVTQIAPDSQN